MSGIGRPVPIPIKLCPCLVVVSGMKHKKDRRKRRKRVSVKESEEVGSKRVKIVSDDTHWFQVKHMMWVHLECTQSVISR